MIESASDLSAAIERACRSRYWGHPSLEDVIQEANIEAWRRIQDGQDYSFALQGALWRAADIVVGKQTFGSPARSQGSGSRKPVLTSYEERTEALGDWVIAPPVDPERAAFIDDVLELLGPVEKFIVESMMAGYVHAEIAEALEVSVAAVRKRMPTIRRKLADALPDLKSA